MEKKLLILDCDGVLVRSENANLAYYNHLFAMFGLPQVEKDDREKRKLLHTLSTPQVIKRFFPEEAGPRVQAYADTHEFLDFAELLEPEPGWIETLTELRERARICVATNRGRSAPQLIEMLGLANLVEEVFTVHHVANPKPAPDILLLALKTFATAREQALYVGDSELDRQASSGAGIKFVGFRIDGEFRIEYPGELKLMC